MLSDSLELQRDPLTFLVVESEAVVAQLLTLKLKMLFPGSATIIATTATQAIAELDSGTITLCFLDLFLGNPDHPNGTEVLKRFRNDLRGAAFIVITSETRSELAAKAMVNGAYDYLVKGHYDDFELEKCVAYAIYRKQREEEIALMATRDPLTGLANRILFHDRLEGASRRSHREQNPVALLYLDIDGFKRVNDSHGHAMGDMLLQAISGRLKTRVRQTDTVARLGGDEFAILLEKARDGGIAQRLAQELHTTLVQPYELEGVTLTVGASIGVTLFPEDAPTIEEALELADSRMYRAKRAGGGVLAD